MKKFLHVALVAASLTAALFAPVDQALAQGHGGYGHAHTLRALPGGNRMYAYGGSHYYFANGFWYAPHGPGFIAIAPPFGMAVDVLPWGYRTAVVAGLTYFVLNDIWYQQAVTGGYVVVAPPAGAPMVAGAPALPPTAGGGDVYVYPAHGQSEADQARDRYECHAWASQQTGFDPTRPLGGVPPEISGSKGSDYRRAMSACLTGRGYTVN